MASVANLAVSVMDLKLVQDVIGAMRAADAGSQSAKQSPLDPLPSLNTRHRIKPEPQYEPRQIVHPEPRYAQRRVIHPITRLEEHARPRLALVESTTETQCVHKNTSPIKAPWSVLPWQQKVEISVPVKVIRYHTDILSKGSMIDMFI